MMPRFASLWLASGPIEAMYCDMRRKKSSRNCALKHPSFVLMSSRSFLITKKSVARTNPRQNRALEQAAGSGIGVVRRQIFAGRIALIRAKNILVIVLKALPVLVHKATTISGSSVDKYEIKYPIVAVHIASSLCFFSISARAHSVSRDNVPGIIKKNICIQGEIALHTIFWFDINKNNR